MDIGSSFFFTDVADNMDTLDTYRLDHLLSKHSSGVNVLSALESGILGYWLIQKIIKIEV